MTRRGYLDWLRGVAVLVMVEAHLFDSWVAEPDRSEVPYQWSIILGGFSAPLFLFLAGVALALAAGSRSRRGAAAAEVAALARKRGWQILGLAFLFRLQSFLVSGGPFPETVLKVDILNVMGLSMVMAGAVWTLASTSQRRAALLVTATVAFAVATPIVRPAAIWESFPYPIQWYARAVPGSGAFSLFPWPGFLLAGVAIGIWLDTARTADAERRVNAGLGLVGVAVAVGGYAASLLPAVFTTTTFWTGSPTFFFVRLGVLIAAVPLAYAWTSRFTGWSPLREFGLASLFVYWIHVEMVYGVVSLWLHKSLTFGQAVAAYLAFCVFLYGLVKLKERMATARLGSALLTASPLTTVELPPRLPS